MRIFATAWFARFVRREKIADAALAEAVARAGKGLIDADLGGGVIKQRVARPGQGKSKGYRTIILFRQGERAVFVYGFAKSAKANIEADLLEQFRKQAEIVLTLSDEQMDAALEGGQYMELK